MVAYVYRATLLCENCAGKVKFSLQAANQLACLDIRGDSQLWPQGPYPDGGGEADCPQHCDDCGVFLENPLTTDGYEYVRSAVLQMHPDTVATDVWAPFYL